MLRDQPPPRNARKDSVWTAQLRSSYADCSAMCWTVRAGESRERPARCIDSVSHENGEEPALDSKRDATARCRASVRERDCERISKELLVIVERGDGEGPLVGKPEHELVLQALYALQRRSAARRGSEERVARQDDLGFETEPGS